MNCGIIHQPIVLEEDPQITLLKGRRRRNRILLSISLSLVAGGAVVAPRACTAWMIHQARHASQQGAELVAQGAYDTALPLLYKAWRRFPRDAGVLRNIATACDGLPTGAVDARRFWSDLVQGGTATTEDRIALAASCMKVGRTAEARRALEPLSAAERRSKRAAQVEVSILQSEGRAQEAQDVLRSIWESSPDNPGNRLNLAELDMKAPFESLRQEAHATLWKFARSRSQEATRAIVAIASSPDLTREEAADIVNELSKASPGAAAVTDLTKWVSSASTESDGLPSITDEDRLKILGLCAHRCPELTDKIIQEEARRVVAKDPRDRPRYYEWLARLGAADRILHDLGEGGRTFKAKIAVLHSRDLFLACGDALIDKGRWSELNELLSQKELPLSPFDADMMRILCASALHEDAGEIRDRLESVLDLAWRAKDEASISRVANLAQQIRQPSVAVKACLLLTENPKLRNENLLRMIPLQRQLGDGCGMLRIANEVLSQNPGLTDFEDLRTYLRLLTGSDMESAQSDLTSDNSRGTPSSLHQLSTALAAYRTGNFSTLRNTVGAVDATRLATGPRAVLAGLLAASGDKAGAYRVAEKVFPVELLPEEDKIFRLSQP